MAITAAQINAKATAAAALIEAGDYAAALPLLRSVKLLLSTLPNTVKDGFELQWNPAALDALIADCQRERSAAVAAAAGGMQPTKITYKNPDALDTW